MIKLSDIVFREYIEKDCCAFQYKIKLSEGSPIMLRFRRVMEKEIIPTKGWRMDCCLNNDNNFNKFVSFYFEMPKNNMPLEVICATGLFYVKNYIAECIDYLTEASIELSSDLSGMYI